MAPESESPKPSRIWVDSSFNCFSILIFVATVSISTKLLQKVAFVKKTVSKDCRIQPIITQCRAKITSLCQNHYRYQDTTDQLISIPQHGSSSDGARSI